MGLSVGSLGGHPERRAKPEVEGSLVSKGDPSTPPRCGSAQDDCSILTAKPQISPHTQKGAPFGTPLIRYKSHETNEMLLISMESPSRAAVKKSKRITLS